MAEIINLRQQRKAKTRADKEKHAHDNRIRHGLKKADKTLARTTNELDRRQLDGKTLNGDDD